MGGLMHIGRKYGGRSREYVDRCDYCGVDYHRADLVLDPAGMLACPDDRAGRTALEIDMLRASDGDGPTMVEGKRREGPG